MTLETLDSESLTECCSMMYQGFINAAQFIGAGVMQGSNSIPSKMAWRTPLIVMMTAPLVLLVLTPLLPETPRKFSDLTISLAFQVHN